MIILSKEQILLMHDQLIEETGGSKGLKDEGMLGNDLFPSVYQKAARLGYGLASNHAFVDGNKRIGAHAMFVFLALNRIRLDYTQEELSDLFLGVAADEKGYSDVLNWLVIHLG